MGDLDAIGRRWKVVKAFLNEDQRRIWLASEVREIGEGGISAVAKATGVSRTTVARAKEDMEGLEATAVDPKDIRPAVRQRRQGGGRKSLLASQPGLWGSVLERVEPAPIDGYLPPLLWTTQSRDKLAEDLCDAGYKVRGPALGELLKRQGFRVRGSATYTGSRSQPTPSEQFQYVNARLVGAIRSGWPVLGLDLFRVCRHSTSKDDAPGLTSGVLQRRDDRLWEEAPARDMSMECGVCGASEFNLGHLCDIDPVTVQLAAQALDNWWNTVGVRSGLKTERLVFTVGGMGGEEQRMAQLVDAMRAVVSKNGLPLEMLRLPAGTSRWRHVVQRFSLASNCYDVGRNLERHEVILEVPDRRISSRIDVQTDAPLPSAADKLQGAASKRDGKKWYPEWAYHIGFGDS